MICVGIRTSDNIVFLADSLFSVETITKYHLFFIYDVREYLNTLEKLRSMEGILFIPSHCEATSDITNLIETNKKKIEEVIEIIYKYCTNEHTFEEILKYIFDRYCLTMNAEQYVLVGSTIRSYLSYLSDENRLKYEFKDNKMMWSKRRVDL